MATLIPNAKKNPGRMLRCIECYVDGDRKRITLGNVTGGAGEDFRRRVEEIIEDLRLGQKHSGSLCDWLNDLPSMMQQRLQNAGLLKSTRAPDVLLGDFLDSITKTTTVKESTATIYGHTMRCLIAHFGRNRALKSISHADATNFKDEYLQSPTAAYGARRLAKPTISRRVILARQFFKIAKTKKLIEENPFLEIKAGNQRNKKRLVFVESAWVDKMITATTDQDWRILLSLARYGGIRLPSEVVQLQWKHVDFDPVDGSILVHSPKTEHHEGKETRLVPLFDELRSVLEVVHAKGVNPDDFVIVNPNYRRMKSNMRTQFGKIAKKAGVKPWPKAFQNMRATRETELIKSMGITDACEVIGNSPTVALQHYDMISPNFLKSAIELAREAKKKG